MARTLATKLVIVFRHHLNILTTNAYGWIETSTQDMFFACILSLALYLKPFLWLSPYRFKVQGFSRLRMGLWG